MNRFANVVDAEQLRQAELEFILGQKPNAPDAEPSVWGLALSGGGIRSATFALGVLQVLARNHLLSCFHYQSTISGGGYIGAFLQGLIQRRGFKGAVEVLRYSIRDGEDPDPQRPILHLREYSNYLSPHKTPLSGDTLGMLGTYVRNVLLIQVQLCAMLLALSLLPLLLYILIEQAATRWPIVLLIAAGVSGVFAATLLGWVTTRANTAGIRSRGSASDAAAVGTATDATTGTAEDMLLPAVAGWAALSILLLAFAAMLGAVGLWGVNADLISARAFFSSATGHVACLISIVASFTNFDLVDAGLLVWTCMLYFGAWMAWLCYDFIDAKSRLTGDSKGWRSPLMFHVMRFVASTLVAAVLCGFSVVAARHVSLAWPSEAGLWRAMIFGPTCVLAAITLTGIVHLGLAGPALSDLQREVWARVGGKTAGFVVVGMGVTLAVAIYGPWLLAHSLSFAEGKWHSVGGWVGIIAWILTSGSGVLVAYSQRVGDPKTRSPALDRLARVAPWVFLLGLLVAISRVAQALLSCAGWDAWSGKEVDSSAAYLGYLSREAMSHPLVTLAVLGIAAATWLLFGLAVDPNEFSMNAFYRNRIVRCYLGASNQVRAPEPITNFDPRDDIFLADLVNDQRNNGTRPLFPLIGTTLNLVATKQLDWQDRKAASFCMTPGYCGYIPPPSHPSACPIGDAHVSIAGTGQQPAAREGAKTASPECPVATTLTLGSAIAISGAAVSPNMGYHSSPAVTFLLTLFDARLGWWLRNPDPTRGSRGAGATFFGWWLIKEMLGLTQDQGRYLNLSDGGHFENLGLYELVRRGCKFILSVDASADPDRDFADLGNAIQKCRTDFGVDIRIDVSALQCNETGISSRSCAMGKIRYPDGKEGRLLYIKPALTGSEPTDVTHYHRAHPSFPHEPTADQFFDEAQFESYRRLGENVAISAIESALERAGAPAPSDPPGELGVHDSALKERILIELQHQWVAPLMGVHQYFSTHAAAMSRLFSELRRTPALSVLDAQIYPPWTDLASPGHTPGKPESEMPSDYRTCMPSNEAFRACFYFCQELTRLMESVYHDLELEQAWDHPDNSGWMNAFRQWSWLPIFRVAWTVGSPTYGRPFVTFCELRLDLPRLIDVVHVVDMAPLGISWKDYCNQLAKDGHINSIEQSILLSQPILMAPDLKADRSARLRLLLLRMKWKAVLGRSDATMSDTTLGIAVLDGSTLLTMRIQDHLRMMGLGAEFMRLLVAKCVVSHVRVSPGHYGALGVCTGREAKLSESRIQALLARALTETRAQTQAAHARKNHS